METYIKARPVANYRMCASTPYRQNFGKNNSKNEMQRNSRTQYFQDYGHKNKSFTIHVTSYKEPELISNDDISWLNDWWNIDHTYTTEYGEIYTKEGGGGNENHKSRIVGCMTSLNGIFGAFGGGTAHIMASGNWTDFFEGLTLFLKQVLSSSPVIHEETNNLVDPFEVSKDSAKMEIWTAYIKRDGWTGKVSSRDTVVPMSERDSLNKREDMYKDVYRIDKVKW